MECMPRAYLQHLPASKPHSEEESQTKVEACLDRLHAGRSVAEIMPAYGTNSHNDHQQATCLDGVHAGRSAAEFVPAYGTNSHTDRRRQLALMECMLRERLQKMWRRTSRWLTQEWSSQPGKSASRGGGPGGNASIAACNAQTPVTQQSKHALSATLTQPFQNVQTLSCSSQSMPYQQPSVSRSNLVCWLGMRPSTKARLGTSCGKSANIAFCNA